MSFYRGKRATKTKTTSSKYRVSGCGRMDDLRKSIVTPDDFHAPPRTLYSGARIHARRCTHAHNARINNSWSSCSVVELSRET